MKFKKWIMTSLLIFTFLTTNLVCPEVVNFVTHGKSTSIVYASTRGRSGGFKSGSFKSVRSKSSSFKSGSFKSGSSSFGGFTSSKKGSSSNKSYSTKKSYVPLPIPIPMFSRHSSYGHTSLLGNLFGVYLFGKIIKILFIIFVIYIIYRFIFRRRY